MITLLEWIWLWVLVSYYYFMAGRHIGRKRAGSFHAGSHRKTIWTQGIVSFFPAWRRKEKKRNWNRRAK